MRADLRRIRDRIDHARAKFHRLETDERSVIAANRREIPRDEIATLLGLRRAGIDGDRISRFPLL